MFVMPVQDALELDELVPHQDLLSAGKLVPFDDREMLGIFVSHQWCGFQHPDPNFKQFRVFQEALRGILEGRIRLETPAQLDGADRAQNTGA